MACVGEREAAVREVAQVYELIKLQQPLLLLHSPQHPPPPSTTKLAQSLLAKALRALNVALSVMKQQQPVVVVKAEPHQLSPPSPASANSQVAIVPSTATRGAKRRRSSVAIMEGKKKTSSSSWATVTAVPYDDGYEWRKYGEKKINGTLFTRSYFRCTYKDDAGCLATKHVQQRDDNSDLPMFHVTYNNDHTCNRAKAAGIANNGSSSSNLAALLAGCCSNGSGSGSGKGLTTMTTTNARPTEHAAAAAAMNMMKQEPPLLLPALIDLQQPSACFPNEQIPQCQKEPLFPTSMEQQFVCGALRDHDSPVDGDIPSATGSCNSGETSWWDGYSGDMAAQMAAEDDPLHDLDRFLQCDSFMDY
ncbi:hypothetical protein BDA96_05G013100 [Sorghum bicolor]|uniref:WRKY domain-containing protein n=1 Tax=Sorghum bicolor TaxID=4558 RepID=A0A921QUY4_SORBI|nr:hypothetical protein BDA96_05G013100 [Sorghum bicolor]